MRRLLCSLVLTILTCHALNAECGPLLYYETGNFSYDLVGTPDTRPGTWGRASAQYSEYTFTDIPSDEDGNLISQVRILKITGDVTAWWTTRGRGRAWPGYGYHTGVLGAITVVPRSDGSTRAYPSADDTLVYVQGVLGFQGDVRIPIEVEFDERVVNSVLPYGKLWFKAADYLNTTRFGTHVEITFSVTFCYVEME